LRRRLQLSRIASAAWLGAWTWVLVHACFSSRGQPSLKNPIGSTFAPNPDTATARFAVLGDIHSFRKPLRQFIEILKNDTGYEFAVQLGDFVDYDEDLSYHHFRDRLGSTKGAAALYLTRGNHEAIDFTLAPSDRYRDFIPDSTFHFIHANTLFLFLDNAHATFTADTINQAKSALEEFHRDRPGGKSIVFAHIPPNCPQSKCSDLLPSSSKVLLTLCHDYEIDYLVTGHVHDHFDFTAGKTTVIVDGSGGGSLLDPSPQIS
jgi:predicted phosphodiesterase